MCKSAILDQNQGTTQAVARLKDWKRGDPATG